MEPAFVSKLSPVELADLVKRDPMPVVNSLKKAGKPCTQEECLAVLGQIYALHHAPTRSREGLAGMDLFEVLGRFSTSQYQVVRHAVVTALAGQRDDYRARRILRRVMESSGEDSVVRSLAETILAAPQTR